MRLALALVLLAACGCGDDDATPLDAALSCADRCDDGLYCNGVETCDERDVCRGGAPPCAEGARCVEAEDTCVTSCETPDADGDGVEARECGGEDCDDSDDSVYPGATEVCDPEGVDEDCDPSTFGDRDVDGDGEISYRCCNGERCGRDCDDTREAATPGAVEVCNLRDDDCDGSVDEEVALNGFADRDGDLHGDPDAPLSGCAGWAGITSSNLDCDDENPARHGAQVEVRDGVDNDCDTRVDEMPGEVVWYRDADGDGFGDARVATVRSDAPVEGHVLLGTDCDDSDAARSPITAERCNGRDDDCDPRSTYPLGRNDDEDDDRDGWPDARCPDVAAADRDCDDEDPSVHPRAAERCDGRDQDCDGTVDEACDVPVDAGVDAGGCDGLCDDADAVLNDCGCPAAGQSCAPLSSSLFGCASRGVVAAGGTCAVSADCAPGHECRDTRCIELCAPLDTACTGDRLCSRALSPAGYFATVPPGLGLCTDACDPIANVGCPSGQTCSIAAHMLGYFAYCRPVLGSPLPVGSDCGITTECDDGLTCESVEGNRRCRDVCGPECPGGLACGPVAEFTDGAPFRFCWPL
ncbi:MAG: putative metal-binding motif-containing protein [Polyangiales bacterium]